MKIKNTTNWETKDLRKIFQKAYNDVAKWEGRKLKSLKVNVLNCSGRNDMIGKASVGWGYMIIRINPQIDLNDIEYKRRLVHYFTHELYHNYGYTKIDARNYQHDTTEKYDYSWVDNMPIRKKEVVIKPKKDIVSMRFERARANLKKAETRLKRAKTIFNKWSRSVKYYELKMANKQK